MKTIFYILITLSLSACGKDIIKKTEYQIDGEWRHCSNPMNEACGMTLICGSETYRCMNDVPLRLR